MERFGSYEFSLQRRQLLRDGQAVHLSPKAFDLLAILIQAAPNVVSKRELHDRLWPRGVVSDATLAGLIKELRRAIRDGGGQPPVIRTAHRVGYAFDLPLASSAAPSQHWLMMDQRRLRLADGENLIGRDARAHIRLDYSTISRRHARITVGPEGAVLEDLGSKNGTTVEGIIVTQATHLRDGDRIGLGDVVLTYGLPQGECATVTRVGVSSARDGS